VQVAAPGAAERGKLLDVARRGEVDREWNVRRRAGERDRAAADSAEHERAGDERHPPPAPPAQRQSDDD